MNYYKEKVCPSGPIFVVVVLDLKNNSNGKVTGPEQQFEVSEVRSRLANLNLTLEKKFCQMVAMATGKPHKKPHLNLSPWCVPG